jgi:hypothetical protein
MTQIFASDWMSSTVPIITLLAYTLAAGWMVWYLVARRDRKALKRLLVYPASNDATGELI